MVPRPIENCYWVEPDKLLAGEYPRNADETTSKSKVAALLDAGISVFIDLTGERDRLEPYAHLIGGAAHLQFSIPDFSVPRADSNTVSILDAIDGHLAIGKMVYVHCWGGVGRTGLIVGCWLARHGLGGKAALERVHELWRQCPKSATHPRSPETSEQDKYILHWEVGS